MQSWIVWMVAGCVMIAGGVLALLNPLAATLTAEQIAAWIFVLAGILQAVAAFQAERRGARVWAILLAVAFLALGLSLLTNPLAGIVALTIVVASAFLVSGIAKVAVAFSLRGSRLFWPLLGSGAISLVLAFMVFFNLPQSATVLLGVLLAVELLASGATIASYAYLVGRGRA